MQQARGGRGWLRAALATVLALVLLVATRQLWGPAAPDLADEPLTVEVIRAARGDLVRETRVTGWVVPTATVHLSPKLPGRVVEFPVRVGQPVKAGDLILRLESRELASAAQQAQGAWEAAKANYQRLLRGASPQELDQAQAVVDQAQAGYQAAQQAHARAEILFAEGAIPRQQWESALTQLEVSAASLTMAQRQLETLEAGAPAELLAVTRASLTQAEAAYDLARQRVTDAVLLAPRDGIIAHTGTSVGEMVGAGSVVAVVIALDEVYVEAGLAESLLTQVQVGDELEVSVPAVHRAALRGKVTLVAPAADSRTRLFAMQLLLDNADHQFKAGMLAEVKVPTGRAYQQILLPRRALITRGRSAYVFVIAEGVAQRRRVQTGLADAEYVVISDGVYPGELVVTRGGSYLEDGMPVRTRVMEEAS